MQMEAVMYRGNDILKIYDQNFTNIGTATREEIHTKGLLHQVAHVWMIKPDKKNPEDTLIFFQKRSAKRDLYPGKYDMIQTTHFDPEESYEEAIVTSMEYYLGSEVTQEEIHHIGTTRQIIDEGNYHDNALVQVFVIEVSKVLFLMPMTDEIIKIRYRDFIQMFNGEKEQIPMYSLENTFLKNTKKEEFWLRIKELQEVILPYMKSRIAEED